MSHEFLLLLGFLSIAELLLGSAVFALIFYPLRKARLDNLFKRASFISFGVVLASPALAPAGSIMVIPLPFGIFLAFTRSSSDANFLLRNFWFTAPSMLITGLVFWYVARRLFPKTESLQLPLA